MTCEVSGPADTNSAQRQNTAERDMNKKACVAQAQGMEAFLEKIEAAPYVINGVEKGLRITGLDDLSPIGYFGFENDDVIQALNGQILNDKQKAFQVLKKARSQSSLHFQILRDQQKMDLSFRI